MTAIYTSKHSGRTAIRILLILLAVLFLLREAACDYVVIVPKTGTGIGSGISVVVTPSTATILPGGALSMTDSVSGWMRDGTVSWFLSDTIGTLTFSGSIATYRAPAQLKINPTIVVVRARSNEDTSRSGYCTITVSSTDTSHEPPIQIQLSPVSVTLQQGGSQLFQTTITGTSNKSVSWLLVSGLGTLSNTGLYTAPSSISSNTNAIVKAIAQADTSVWAEATVTLQAPVDTTPCFQSEILPIIVSNCTMSGCHSAGSHGDASDLTTYSGIMRYVSSGSASSSRLYRVITSSGGEDAMPPYPRTKLTADQIALIARWINDGAKNTSCTQSTSNCDTSNVLYSSFVKGVIQNNCLGCHSGPSMASSGGIDLSTYNGVQAVALNGQLVGGIEGSGFPLMPQGGIPLDSCTVAKIRAWVNAGAQNN